ncbi:sensor histidine kinase [Streptomyces sp. NPDC018045]|uniref:sensor histidine kinase n=1 Tax=Streptomyces sp. NPDC018045 TaxID=3365037 RepID=UPI003789B380
MSERAVPPGGPGSPGRTAAHGPRAGVLRRVPTEARAAILAGLAACVVFTAGAWWLRGHVYDETLRQTAGLAAVQARTTAATEATTDQSHVFEQGFWPKIEIDDSGRLHPAAGIAVALDGLDELLPPAPPDAGSDWTRTATLDVERTRGLAHRWHAQVEAALPRGDDPAAATLRKQAHQRIERLLHRDVTAVAARYTLSAHRCTDPADAPGRCRRTVYHLVLPDDADAAVASLDAPLKAGVPAAALVVAATAWITTRRSLHPVEAIRAQVADITDTTDLHRRVPVPVARDRIRALAETTNTTLNHLEEAAERQRRFVADASHELRSPLTALHTQLEIALAHPEHLTEAVLDALKATDRLRRVTDDLLYLARPDTAEPRDVVDLVEIAHELAHEYGHHGHPITLGSFPEEAPASGDALQLHRLLRNLLDNAHRHAADRVTVTIAPHEDGWDVSVHNDGAPLAPQDLERVFERFTRLDEARARDTGGSGLGLAIARDIAHRHHGTLTAHTHHPGPGTTFTLHLPATDTSP